MSTADGKKIAIVTGSALGLGYELTRQLIAKGWFVAGIDFNGARQAELSKTFAADEYRAFVGDISDESFVKNSIAAISKIGHIDLLINNAGQPSFKVPTAYEAADVDKCLKGLKGMVLWSVETLKADGERDLKIANVMSTAATRGNPNESVYRLRHRAYPRRRRRTARGARATAACARRGDACTRCTSGTNARSACSFPNSCVARRPGLDTDTHTCGPAE